MKKIMFLALTFLFQQSFAAEYLIQLQRGAGAQEIYEHFGNALVEDLGINNWYKITVQDNHLHMRAMPAFVNQIETNKKYKIALYRGPQQRPGGGLPFPFPGGGDGGGDNGGGGGLPFPFPGGGDGGGDNGGGGGLPFPFPGGGDGGGDNGGGGGLPFPFPGGGDGGGDGGGSPFPFPGGGSGGGSGGGAVANDPAFPTSFPETTGADPDAGKQWGMTDIGVKEAWQNGKTDGSAQIVVAVIDTGIDYTHEDLAKNVWRNPGEMGKDSKGNDKSTNGIDDDNNGYIDDVVGWDFAENDNKPYDKTSGSIFTGGNPGHGSHCSGNIAAVANNGKGIFGIAPNVKVMAMRFLTEKGEGSAAGAIKAIKYAVDNGARVLSNSWGSEGDVDPNDPNSANDSKALQDAIHYAMDKGVLFVAAAGNGHQGFGYDNDTDSKPGYPASYKIDNIVSVAAVDKSDRLGSFSNWGKTTVHLGAPGVAVYSTIPGNKYMNLDGTSMACPHVAGAAALYWSKHPQATWKEVKDALIHSAKPISALSNKSVSGGKLDVKALLNL